MLMHCLRPPKAGTVRKWRKCSSVVFRRLLKILRVGHRFIMRCGAVILKLANCGAHELVVHCPLKVPPRLLDRKADINRRNRVCPFFKINYSAFPPKICMCNCVSPQLGATVVRIATTSGEQSVCIGDLCSLGADLNIPDHVNAFSIFLFKNLSENFFWQDSRSPLHIAVSKLPKCTIQMIAGCPIPGRSCAWSLRNESRRQHQKLGFFSNCIQKNLNHQRWDKHRSIWQQLTAKARLFELFALLPPSSILRVICVPNIFVLFFYLGFFSATIIFPQEIYELIGFRNVRKRVFSNNNLKNSHGCEWGHTIESCSGPCCRPGHEGSSCVHFLRIFTMSTNIYRDRLQSFCWLRCWEISRRGCLWMRGRSWFLFGVSGSFWGGGSTVLIKIISTTELCFVTLSLSMCVKSTCISLRSSLLPRHNSSGRYFRVAGVLQSKLGKLRTIIFIFKFKL